MNIPDYFIGGGEYINHNCGIYAVVNPDGEIYIGQSVNIPLRVRNYKKAILASGKLKKSIFKHGRTNHKFYSVEKLPDNSHIEKLWEREKYHISKLKNDGYTLLNSNNGGGGSHETMRRMYENSATSKILSMKIP